MITYRLLPVEEWEKLVPLYSKLFPNSPFPSSDMCTTAVAENEEGTIVGFWFYQLCAHLEPVGVDPQAGQQVNLFGLRNVLYELLANCSGMEYYISTPDASTGTLLERAGYTPVGITFSAKIP